MDRAIRRLKTLDREGVIRDVRAKLLKNLRTRKEKPARCCILNATHPRKDVVFNRGKCLFLSRR